jgi:hypothetical protein
MTEQEIKELNIGFAEEGLKLYLGDLVKRLDRYFLLKKKSEQLSAKQKLSEDEKKQKEEFKANLEQQREQIEDTQSHIEIMRSLITSFSKDEPVKL